MPFRYLPERALQPTDASVASSARAGFTPVVAQCGSVRFGKQLGHGAPRDRRAATPNLGGVVQGFVHSQEPTILAPNRAKQSPFV
jgi:hypothetical protein